MVNENANKRMRVFSDEKELQIYEEMISDEMESIENEP